MIEERSAEQEEKPRLVILISGSGSNMEAIADQVRKGDIDADIAAVISNRPDVAGLQKAKDRDLQTQLVDHTQFASREEFDVALMRAIDEYQPDLIVLAGFMRILTADFVRRYQGRMLNIHPSLLPHYPGLNTHQRALDNGDAKHGVTVHFVTEELDGGPNAIQAEVPIYDGDSVDSLRARVQQQEHVIYPIAVKWCVQGRLSTDGKAAFLDGTQLPATGVVLTS
ncbi:phosphoribosylglycinamide formyltransferase [Bacterioplanes sanyensis]|uniref:Phosphoribosylglycinamide formyltransferase n=1 Tax=Bacterioplanes sanyensis TaxID=1249553 RepID=A0A222FMW4_9GAMM|nr:phosphoribosylglycinamide formyltransferase [Bacterioplanes sanyensis]ASP40368.1 phosphoribosylglycinamide formyltransferase [Bacterioplanes sanyensis]